MTARAFRLSSVFFFSPSVWRSSIASTFFSFPLALSRATEVEEDGPCGDAIPVVDTFSLFLWMWPVDQEPKLYFFSFFFAPFAGGG